jgi:hypothetical protein
MQQGRCLNGGWEGGVELGVVLGFREVICIPMSIGLGLFLPYHWALSIILVFLLTELENRINRSYFGYLELGTKIFGFGSGYFSSVFFVLGYFCPGL